MPPSSSPHFEPAGPASRRAALLVLGVMAAASTAAVPIAWQKLPDSAGFLPAIGGMTIFVHLLTAALLFAQARVLADRATARLALAHLYAGLSLAPYLLAFPGAFSKQPRFGHGESAVWLWWASHLGFALLVIRHAVLVDRRRVGPVRIVRPLLLAFVVVAVVSAVSTFGIDGLPTISDGRHLTAIGRLFITPMLLATTMFAFVLVATRLSRRDQAGLWLTIAIASAVLDVTLTLLGGPRFSLSWYLSRLFGFGSGFAVLAAELSMLVRLIGRTIELNRRLTALSLTDALTGLANRRAFDAALAIEWRRAARDRSALSLLMIDVDHFKRFNDRYGHPAGDVCLRTVAAALRPQLQRAGDLAARIGGEEFALLLPQTGAQGALQLAERALAAVRTLRIAHEDGIDGRVSISIGVATVPPMPGDAESGALVEAADRALYAAKQDGRNRVGAPVPAVVALPFRLSVPDTLVSA